MEKIEIARELVKKLRANTEKSPCIIMVGDKQVTLPSGKSSWKDVASARKAFTNFLSCRLSYPVNVRVIREELEREGLVEFKTF